MQSPEASYLSEERKKLAYEELLIAEGSDWNWWYGPEHDSANRPEFDQLFRDHLANVYTALGLTSPEELSRPILKVIVSEYHQPPTGPVKAKVDGEVTSYFEWLGAGVYRVDHRSGAMHGQRFFVQELRYGSDGQSLYLRLDFVENSNLQDIELRLNVQPVSSTETLVSRAVPLTERLTASRLHSVRSAKCGSLLPRRGLRSVRMCDSRCHCGKEGCRWTRCPRRAGSNFVRRADGMDDLITCGWSSGSAATEGEQRLSAARVWLRSLASPVLRHRGLCLRLRQSEGLRL